MVRVVGRVVTATLLVLGVVACTSESDPEDPVDASESVAVEPDEVVRHEASAGTPISFGIDVPDGAVQVGPLIRQRRLEVEKVIEETGGGRADAFGNDDENGESVPEPNDPEKPAPPDFTTALLRVDDDPGEVVQAMIGQIKDVLPESGVEPEQWERYCTVTDGVYTGCELAARGVTEEDEYITVELTVDPGDPKSKVATAGSLLRPVMALTIEQHPTPDGDGELEEGEPSDPAHASQNGNGSAKPPRDERSGGARDDGRAGDRNDNGDQDTDEDTDKPDDEQSEGGAAKWPSMETERPAKPRDWILTPQWLVRPKTDVILSTSSPKVAMLAVQDGADADAIARAYVRKFADEATTPKIDEVEDRNELSITYTPRNDGTGPAVAVTAVATGRGNYIELLFAPDDSGAPGQQRGRKGNRRGPGHKKAENRTRSSTG